MSHRIDDYVLLPLGAQHILSVLSDICLYFRTLRTFLTKVAADLADSQNSLIIMRIVV